MTDLSKYSELATSSSVVKSAYIEHPVHISPRVQVHGECKIGNFTFINSDTVIFPHVKIGRFCSIAKNCEIGVANHPLHFLSTHSFQYHAAQFPNYPNYKDSVKRVVFRGHPETFIGNDVWIGAKCVIKSGITIGDGAVIAAGSVVTKNVPAYSIFGGVPAKLIKNRFSHEQITRLLKVKWWDLSFEDIQTLPFDDIDKCLDLLEQLQLSNNK